MAAKSNRSAQAQAQFQQYQAWSYYGYPSDKAAPAPGRGGRKAAINPIGEVRYVVGWAADQMSRMGWSLLINGKADWTLALPGGGTIVSSSDEDDADAETSNAAASRRVLRKLIGWTPETVKQITTNLFVAGQFDYVALSLKDAKSKLGAWSIDGQRGGDNDDATGGGEQFTWRVVSTIDPLREELIEAAKHVVDGLWAHPADPFLPDAPLFGVLPILEEMDWLSRLSRHQMAHRMSLRGIVGFSDQLTSPNGGDVWAEFKAASEATMVDPTNVGPVAVKGSPEMVEPSGKGMKGLSWVIPDFPADQRVDEKMSTLIQRLAYGLPIPPEILLGLQAQSRATAYQVEENSYRGHIEPPALILAEIARRAVSFLLPDGTEATVVPDPTDLLARRHSTQDVKDALEVGAVSYAYYREVLDIPETAAPDEADLALIERMKGVGDDPAAHANDPANVAAQPPPAVAASSPAALTLAAPIVAAVGGPNSPGLDGDELQRLSEQLAEIDRALMMELSGATAQAADRARDRVGARARTFEGLRKAVGKDVPNSQVVSVIGLQTVTDTGVPVADIVADALEPLGAWWTRRAEQAQATVLDLIGPDAGLELNVNDVVLSTDLLIDLTAEYVLDSFTKADAGAEATVLSGLSAPSRVAVLTALGGGSD